MAAERSWPSRHFSLANPKGRTGPDLPLLLRRVADEIEAQGIDPDSIAAVTVGVSEVTRHGPWWSATVVWTPGDRCGCVTPPAGDAI